MNIYLFDIFDNFWKHVNWPEANFKSARIQNPKQPKLFILILNYNNNIDIIIRE